MRDHPLGRADYDLGALADELLAALGVGVSVQAGHGTLQVLDGDGNAVDVDGSVVAAVIAAHVPPVPQPSPAARLAADLEAATTLAQLRAALLGWAREEASRAAARDAAGRIRASRETR